VRDTASRVRLKRMLDAGCWMDAGCCPAWKRLLHFVGLRSGEALRCRGGHLQCCAAPEARTRARSAPRRGAPLPCTAAPRCRSAAPRAAGRASCRSEGGGRAGAAERVTAFARALAAALKCFCSAPPAGPQVVVVRESRGCGRVGRCAVRGDGRAHQVGNQPLAVPHGGRAAVVLAGPGALQLQPQPPGRVHHVAVAVPYEGSAQLVRLQGPRGHEGWLPSLGLCCGRSDWARASATEDAFVTDKSTAPLRQAQTPPRGHPRGRPARICRRGRVPVTVKLLSCAVGECEASATPTSTRTRRRKQAALRRTCARTCTMAHPCFRVLTCRWRRQPLPWR
jgi:hypothetical protein